MALGELADRTLWNTRRPPRELALPGLLDHVLGPEQVAARCSDLSSYIHTEYGLRPGWFAAVLCGVAMLVGGSLYLLWPKLMLLKAETKVNLRIT